jgi:hypothetical protein
MSAHRVQSAEIVRQAPPRLPGELRLLDLRRPRLAHVLLWRNPRVRASRRRRNAQTSPDQGSRLTSLRKQQRLWVEAPAEARQEMRPALQTERINHLWS